MDIWNIALGFMDAQILLTAQELGVFDTLADEGADDEQVARATGLRMDSARRLLSGLCGIGVVNRSADGRYYNSPEAAEQLVSGRPGYIGSMFHHIREDLYPLWHHFREALEEGEAQWHRAFSENGHAENGHAGNGHAEDAEAPARNEQMFEDPDALRSFMDGMHPITYEAASEFAPQAAELEETEHLVDVGGASGAFLIALAETYPSLRGTVFDLPPVRPITEDYFRRYGVDDRLDFHGGSFWDDPLPEGADAYSLGFILHDWDTDGGSVILDRVAQAARPGGMLIVGEYLLDDDRTGPHHVARQDLNMLVAARGRERTREEYGAWMARHGFALERVVPTQHGKHFLLARKQA